MRRPWPARPSIELVGEPLDRHHAVRVQEQDREGRSLLGTTQTNGQVVVRDLQRSQDAEVKHSGGPDRFDSDPIEATAIVGQQTTGGWFTHEKHARHAVCIAGVSLATAASAATVAIRPHSIAGAKLGKEAAAYKTLLGSRMHVDQPPKGFAAPDNYTRLVFTKRKMYVYFKDDIDRATIITTWNKAYKTAAGIGPCSTVEELKQAYGGSSSLRSGARRTATRTSTRWATGSSPPLTSCT